MELYDLLHKSKDDYVIIKKYYSKETCKDTNNIIFKFIGQYNLCKQLFYYRYKKYILDNIKHSVEFYYTVSKQRQYSINILTNERVNSKWESHYYFNKRINPALEYFLDDINDAYYYGISCETCTGKNGFKINLKMASVEESQCQNKNRIYRHKYGLDEIISHLTSNQHYKEFYKELYADRFGKPQNGLDLAIYKLGSY